LDVTPNASSPAARFWDENREKSTDPAYWMAHPLCRRAINSRVSGSPHEWPLDWFKRTVCRKPFRRGVSWGCGLGAFERAARKIGLVEEIDAFDISPRSIEDAARQARAEQISGIHYRVGDFNDPELPFRRYDIAFFHASLHHVASLERLFRRLRRGLEPGGTIYFDEYVGPSRHQWTQRHLKLAQAMLDLCPREARLGEKLDLPIEPQDPSEAIRSAEIPVFAEMFLEIEEWKPYGGQVVDLLFPYLRSDWVLSAEAAPYVQAMLDVEDYELWRDPAATHYLVAFGRLKQPGRRASLFRRVRGLIAGESPPGQLPPSLRSTM
jgi:SAM-dependent methyltransferase